MSDQAEGLPPELADAIEPVLPALIQEILETIPREVPEYARPFEGSFGRGIRAGVTQALRRFVALIREPGSGADPGRDVYVALGRGELRQGRSLDSLQAAYRVGARVAWRRTSEAAQVAGIAPDVLYRLADAIFAYIDEISAESVEGYAAEQSAREGERERRHGRLLAALIRTDVDAAEIERLAGEASWPVPASLAALACAAEDLARLAGRLPAGDLSGRLEGLGAIVVSDPDGPGSSERIAVACGECPAALGPSVTAADAGSSWREARAGYEALASGALKLGSGDATPLLVEDRLVDLILIEARPRLDRVASRRLAALEDETEASRRRLLATLASHLRHQGRAAEVASELHVHSQTVRYRVNRLRELLGSQLDDPRARFELEAALRVREGPS